MKRTYRFDFLRGWKIVASQEIEFDSSAFETIATMDRLLFDVECAINAQTQLRCHVNIVEHDAQI